MPKVSVIIPVYGVEKYIERCARSLFEQTLDDIEYIFVNDGTKDNSIDVLERVIADFPNRKNCIKIYDKENGGQASAREYGITKATGDYIIHCDSDDWVDTDIYEKLYKKAVCTGAEVVICPVVNEYKDKTIAYKWRDFGNDCQRILENWYFECISMFTYNKLVKRSVYTNNDIHLFEGVNMWEDNGLMLRIFYYAKGLAQIDNATYHYFRDNENALTHNYGRNAVNQMLKCAQLLDDFFKSKPDYLRYKNTADAIKFFARINLVTNSFSGLKEYYNTFPETNAIIPYINRDAFSSKGSIRFYFVKYHLAWLFVLIFKFASWTRK